MVRNTVPIILSLFYFYSLTCKGLKFKKQTLIPFPRVGRTNLGLNLPFYYFLKHSRLQNRLIEDKVIDPEESYASTGNGQHHYMQGFKKFFPNLRIKYPHQDRYAFDYNNSENSKLFWSRKKRSRNKLQLLSPDEVLSIKLKQNKERYFSTQVSNNESVPNEVNNENFFLLNRKQYYRLNKFNHQLTIKNV